MPSAYLYAPSNIRTVNSRLCSPVDELATKTILEQKVEKKALSFGGGVWGDCCRGVMGSDGVYLGSVEVGHGGQRKGRDA